MIDEAHTDLRRWAQWVLEPTPGINLGYGPNMMQKLLEGKGEFLPTAAGGVRKVRSDLVAQSVDQWLKTLDRSQRYVVKLFYLSTNLTVEEKAQRLHITRRQLYNRIETLQRAYQQWKLTVEAISNGG